MKNEEKGEKREKEKKKGREGNSTAKANKGSGCLLPSQFQIL